MVGKHDERSVGANRVERVADDAVETDVKLVDHVRIFGINGRIVRRMARIAGTPHHVGDLVDVAEIVEKQPVRKPIEHIAVLDTVLFAGEPSLREELVARQDALSQSLRVFRHALGVKATGGLCQFSGVLCRLRNRHRR